MSSVVNVTIIMISLMKLIITIIDMITIVVSLALLTFS